MKLGKTQNSSIASRIALNLDRKDGEDNSISKNIWEQFRASCGEGLVKNISGSNITRKEAVKLIMNGIFNAAKRAMNEMGKSVKISQEHNRQLNIIANNWLASSAQNSEESQIPDENSAKVVNEGIGEVPNTPSADDTDNSTAVVQTPEITVDDDKVEDLAEVVSEETIIREVEKPIIPRPRPRKIHSPVSFKVPPKKITAQLPTEVEKRAFSAQQNAEQLSKDIENAFKNISWKHPIDSVNNLKKQLAKINKDNVAFVLNKINGLAERIDRVDLMGLGLNNKDVFKYVLTPLMKKADELGIQYKKLSNTASVEDMAKLINSLKNQVLKHDNAQVKQYKDKTDKYNKNKAEVQEFNANREKYQACFDHANKFLADSLNIKPKPEITKFSGGASIRFNDGRLINVTYDKNGIDSISINHYPNRPDTSVKYTRFQAKCYLVNNKKHLAVDKTKNPESGYDFNKIIAFVKDLLA